MKDTIIAIAACAIGLTLLYGIMWMLHHADDTPVDHLIGKDAQTTSGLRVFVVEKKNKFIFKCRIDNGPNASVRIQEIDCRVDELLPLETEVKDAQK